MPVERSVPWQSGRYCIIWVSVHYWLSEKAYLGIVYTTVSSLLVYFSLYTLPYAYVSILA